MPRHRGAAWLLLAACSQVRSLTAPQFYDSATKAPAFYKLVSRGGGPVFASKPRPQPLVVGVAGGTASGKSSVVSEVVRLLSHERVASITQDCFYRALTPEQHEAAMASDYNFDHPNAFNFDEQLEMLENLRHGAARVELPNYDFVTHSRLPTMTAVEAPQIVIFEGLFTLYDERLRDFYDLKVFVDADADVRLSRRIRRDIAERGRDLDGVLQQYERFVKPSYEEFVLPTKAHADIIVPRGAENKVAIEIIAQHIGEHLWDDLEAGGGR